MARVDPITTEEDMQAAPLRALTRAGHVHTLHCFKNRAALQTSCWTSLSVPCQPQAHQMLNAGLAVPFSVSQVALFPGLLPNIQKLLKSF